MSNLLNPNNSDEFFNNAGYKTIKPHRIMDTPKDNETVFITAGIQPSINEYEKAENSNPLQMFIMQPVLRTQYANSVGEGYSIAFVNPTTAGFNISDEDYQKDIENWMKFFEFIGLDLSKISSVKRDYKTTQWGNLDLGGQSIFYYYDKPGFGKVEIGDSTYYDSVKRNDGKENNIYSLSDSGFGLERLRWCLSDKSYYDLFSDSSTLSPEQKAFISAIGLIAVNGITPSQKSAGYRARLYSKKLVGINSGKDLNLSEQKYLIECIKYWADFQCIDLTKEDAKTKIFDSINKEYNRNCNSYILSQLPNEQQKLVRKINVNLPRKEFVKRLKSAKIDITKFDEER